MKAKSLALASALVCAGLSTAVGAQSIDECKKPLADEKLVAILKQKGYNIARRTIAKYRQQLGIPVARMRKEL